MDASQPCSPHIKKVLKSYQTAAMTSLSGPNGFMASWTSGKTALSEDSASDGSGSGSGGCNNNGGSNTAKKKVKNNNNVTATKCESLEYDPLLAPPPFPIQQMPILVAADQSRSERSETILEGESISCFVVGGEKRLCLPQILNTVLRDFSLQQINAVCDELQIFCSRCNPEQLEVLKVTGILPFSAPSCGLITKTDAERLCSALQLCNPGNHQMMFKDPLVDEEEDEDEDEEDDGEDDVKVEKDKKKNKKRFRFHIYHECFGKCKGIYTPDLYTGPLARCIECTECRAHLSPQKFVCHAHKALENRTCHWGFDSANWKAYILLAKDQHGLVAEQKKTALQKHLDEMKARHDDDLGPKIKRKLEEDEKDAMKKARYEESSSYFPYVYDPMLPMWYPGAGVTNGWPRASAFRPWSPMVGKDGKLAMPPPFPHPHAFPPESLPAQPLPSYLSHGPPVLLNPERVVPVSETQRFERHYQPNVALAPPAAQIQALQKSGQNVSAHSRGKAAATMSSGNSNSNGHLTSPSSQSGVASRAAVSPCTPCSSSRTAHVTMDAPVSNSPNHANQSQASHRYPSEIELSTDTDETFSDSTFDAQSPSCVLSPPRTDGRDAAANKALPAADGGDEQYLDLGKPLTRLRVVMKKEGLSSGVQEKVLQEASLMWKNFEQHLAVAAQFKTEFQQELKRVRQSKKERLRDASESKRELRKEIERLCSERDAWHREASELRLQVDRLKTVQEACQNCSRRAATSCKSHPADIWHHDHVSVKLEPDTVNVASSSCSDTACQVNLPGENEHLRSKIDAMGDELHHLQQEIGQLRRRAESGGKSLTNGTVPVRFSPQIASSSSASSTCAATTGD